jgi:8-oxo-dGTP diphosphatase
VVVRPSAYALLEDAATRLAVADTARGCFLPGGGIEPGETPEDAVHREVSEECGLTVHVRPWSVRAIDIVYSADENAYFEKRSIFFEAQLDDPVLCAPAEHRLLWLSGNDAAQHLLHPSHRWAVTQWRAYRDRMRMDGTDPSRLTP